jgi:acetyl-CoA carboxylase biotin carboxyl carrier protein
MASLKIDDLIFDKLAEILKKHNLSEVEYKQDKIKIRISAINSNTITTNQTIPPLRPTVVEVKQELERQQEPSETSDYSKHEGAVRSPMVGTCYLSPEPGARNFIMVGDSVKEGQPLLIIEAMKVMNLIKAPKSGKIIHIAVSNSNPIEFGQLLVVIE